MNALAHKVFCCTQYIRHHSNPEYTPEPDLIHEVFGHMPLLADPEIAELSQQIGLASLGQSDENVEKIGALYFYTIEFGSFKEGGDIKCYGAGLASCIDEIKVISLLHIIRFFSISRELKLTSILIDDFTISISMKFLR